VVLLGFAGSHPSPVVPRKPRSALERAPACTPPVQANDGTQHAPGVIRHMEIVDVTRETADALTLTLADVRGEEIPFQAGQFMLLRADIAGETLWRAYSICTSPGDEKIAVTIKRIQGGRVSNYLHDHAATGQVLEVRGPSGRFTLQDPTGPQHLLLVAGGSGITPLMSHVRHWLVTAPLTRITLLYGSRRERDIIFRATLDALARAHPDRLIVRHVLDEGSDTTFGRGPLDEAALTRELARIELGSGTRYLLCGPEPMMQACRSVLTRLGVSDQHVSEERFFGLATLSESTTFRAEEVTLSLLTGAKTIRVLPGETILQAALRDQLPLDFSCAMGGCGACMAVLVEGSVHMAEPNCLTRREREAGKVLTCIAQPRSTCRLEQLP
jgi:ferredoxin-NADP reductase